VLAFAALATKLRSARSREFALYLSGFLLLAGVAVLATLPVDL
jgi:hypothetical protein